MKKTFLFFLFFSFSPFFMSAHLNYKAQKGLEQLMDPITTGINNHFQEYLTTSCRNSENRVLPSQDCYDYLDFKTFQIAREIEKSLQEIDQDLAQRGIAKSQRKTVNEELQNILLQKVLDKTEALHKIVGNDHFARTYMNDISSVALNISDGIKHPIFNRETLRAHLQQQSQRVLDENKKNKIKKH